MALDHLSIYVKDLEKTIEWYTAALAPIGYKLKGRYEQWKLVEFGAENERSDIWLAEDVTKAGYCHFGLICENRELVDQFHVAGLKAGGKCNGPPGVRPWFNPNYYAAFVFDPEGNNIEVLCIKPYESTKPEGQNESKVETEVGEEGGGDSNVTESKSDLKRPAPEDIASKDDGEKDSKKAKTDTSSTKEETA